MVAVGGAVGVGKEMVAEMGAAAAVGAVTAAEDLARVAVMGMVKERNRRR